ncbi:Ribokinase-like protein [Haematococcus lacustris]
MACLKLGADLSHVFTTKAAAAVIRTYSPDLLVHSSFVDSCECAPEQLQGSGREALVQAGCAEVEAWFSRLDCLVLGPGLGRDPLLLDIGQNLVEAARKVGLPLVLDGDGLLLAARAPEVVRGYSTCVMTPNLNEFRRLSVTLGVSLHGPNSDRLSKLRDVTQLLAGPVLLSKGPTDAIHDGQHPVLCSASGGLRRCRGQGDILSGAVAVFVCWTRAFITRARAGHDTAALLDMNPMMLAAFGASLITRGACHQAFSLKQRAMLAGDVMEQLGGALEALMQSQAGPGPTPRAGTAFKPLDS